MRPGAEYVQHPDAKNLAPADVNGPSSTAADSGKSLNRQNYELGISRDYTVRKRLRKVHMSTHEGQTVGWRCIGRDQYLRLTTLLMILVSIIVVGKRRAIWLRLWPLRSMRSHGRSRRPGEAARCGACQAVHPLQRRSPGLRRPGAGSHELHVDPGAAAGQLPLRARAGGASESQCWPRVL